VSNDTSRREFFRALGRWTLLAALGGVLVKAFAGSRAGSQNDKAQSLALCEQCPAVHSCALPPAKQARRFFGKAASGSSPPLVTRSALCNAGRRIQPRARVEG